MNERLTRSRDDRMLAGVAGGLADYWAADPTLVRLVWVLLVVFSGGLALIVYIVMAIVVPEEDPGRWTVPPMAPSMAQSVAQPSSSPSGLPDSVPGTTPMAPGWTAPPDRHTARRMARAARRANRPPRDESGLRLVIGGLLVIVGILLLVRQFVPQVYFDWFGPVVLIALGALLLLRAFGRHDHPAGPTTGWPAGPQGGAA
jgi:phage shock protein PspC (stress-responsive transcriptional regulator)